ncbi:MAG: YciI family protein [Ignavibacteriaceae bacterium]
MKHFIIKINYTAPIEKIDKTLAEHRNFLQIGYDIGFLLCSGPQNPRTGGIVIARADSKEELELLFKKDPYQINSLAEYEFIEFNPVKHQDFLKDWINKES